MTYVYIIHFLTCKAENALKMIKSTKWTPGPKDLHCVYSQQPTCIECQQIYQHGLATVELMTISCIPNTCYNPAHCHRENLRMYFNTHCLCILLFG